MILILVIRNGTNNWMNEIPFIKLNIPTFLFSSGSFVLGTVHLHGKFLTGLIQFTAVFF